MPEYTDAVKAVLKVILEEHTRLVDEMNVVKSGLEYEAMCDLEEELRDGIAEIKAALEQAGLLSLAYDMLQVAVEHGVPDPSNHVCGSPDANCDVGCMNHAHFFQNVAVIRRAVNKEES